MPHEAVVPTDESPSGGRACAIVGRVSATLETAPEPSPRTRDQRWTSRPSSSRVVLTACGLVLAQLAFRAWAVLGSWFQFDDFSFVSRVLNNPVPRVFVEPYAGHLMPSGMALSWVNHQLGAYEWAWPATELLVMQALASVGCVVLLLSAFGRRWGVIPPLVVYLTSTITLPAVTWWAAGVNQVPFQAAIFWGLWAHLHYLRSRRLRWALATLAITLVSLTFYEKTLTIFFIYAFVALAYFATGGLVARVATLWRTYRAGVLLHGVVALGYLALYLVHGFVTTPDGAEEVDTPVAAVAAEMLPRFLSGVTGGPVTWTEQGAIWQVPDPSTALMVASLVAVVGVVYSLTRSRLNAKRALILPVVLLAATIVLVATSRAVIVGPEIAQDFRYQTEMSAVVAITLGLMSMPLRGAVETVERTVPDPFTDSRLAVGIATATVGALGLWSSVTYVQHWHSMDQSRTYFDNVRHDLASAKQPVPLVDAPVPDFISLPFSWPENSLRWMLRAFEDSTRYPSSNVDQMHMVDDTGRIVPMTIEPLRRGAAQQFPCPHPLEDGAATVELDGPVFGAGFWVRLEYASTADADIVVTAGDQVHDVAAPAGLHSVFFEATGQFSSVDVRGFGPSSDSCIRDVEVGLPRPLAVGEDE